MGVGVKLAVACAALSALGLSLAAGRAAAVGACARGSAANSALLIVHACDLVGHPVIIMVVFDVETLADVVLTVPAASE